MTVTDNPADPTSMAVAGLAASLGREMFGGPGSGPRPGYKRGGQRKIPLVEGRVRSLKDMMASLGDGDLDVDQASADFQALMGGQSYGDGMTVHVARVDVNTYDHLIVEADITDKNDQPVGHVKRAFFYDDDNTLVARHVEMELVESARGKGFATDFNSHMEDWYRDSGVDRVDLFAGAWEGPSSGSVVWAKAGYDWDRTSDNLPASIRELSDKLTNLKAPDESAASLGVRLKASLKSWRYEGGWLPTMPTPYDVVSTNGGRRALEQNPWPGVKHLRYENGEALAASAAGSWDARWEELARVAAGWDHEFEEEASLTVGVPDPTSDSVASMFAELGVEMFGGPGSGPRPGYRRAKKGGVVVDFPQPKATPVGGRVAARFTDWRDVVKDPAVMAAGMELVDKYVSGQSLMLGVGVADPAMLAIAKVQGFDGPPTAVSEGEMDALVAENPDGEMYRGFGRQAVPSSEGEPVKTGEQVIEEFKSGPYFAGEGAYGTGAYMADVGMRPDRVDAWNIAARYADHPPEAVMRAVLAPGSVNEEYDATEHNDMRGDLLDGIPYETPVPGSYARRYRPVTSEQTQQFAIALLLGDEGRFNASIGRDAYRVTTGTVVLNRTAVVVQATTPKDLYAESQAIAASAGADGVSPDWSRYVAQLMQTPDVLLLPFDEKRSVADRLLEAGSVENLTGADRELVGADEMLPDPETDAAEILAAAILSLQSALAAFGGPGSGPRPGYKRDSKGGTTPSEPDGVVVEFPGRPPGSGKFGRFDPKKLGTEGGALPARWSGHANSTEIRYAAEMLLGQGHAPSLAGTPSAAVDAGVLSLIESGGDESKLTGNGVPDKATSKKMGYAQTRVDEAYTFLSELRDADPAPVDLWRGMTVSPSIPGSEALMSLKPGDTFDGSLMSTSPDERLAKLYEHLAGPDAKAVTMKIESGAKAIPMDGLSNLTHMWKDPKSGEWKNLANQFVTGGRMEVVSVDPHGGERGPLITVRQRSVFDPDTGLPVAAHEPAIAAAAGSDGYVTPEFWLVFNDPEVEPAEATVEASTVFGGPGSGPRPGYKRARKGTPDDLVEVADPTTAQTPAVGRVAAKYDDWRELAKDPVFVAEAGRIADRYLAEKEFDETGRKWRDEDEGKDLGEVRVSRGLPVDPDLFGEAVGYTDEDGAYRVYRGTDTAMDAICKAQGFEGLPTVVSESDMDALVAKRKATAPHLDEALGAEMFRGVIGSPVGLTSAECVEQFKTGDMFNGQGTYGCGTYFASVEQFNKPGMSAYGVAKEYARNDTAGITRASVDPSSRFGRKIGTDSGMTRPTGGSAHEPVDKPRADRDTEGVAVKDQIAAGQELLAIADSIPKKADGSFAPTTPAERQQLGTFLMLNETGRLNAAMGFDAANSGMGFIVYNRTILTVQREAVSKPPVRVPDAIAASAGTAEMVSPEWSRLTAAAVHTEPFWSMPLDEQVAVADRLVAAGSVENLDDDDRALIESVSPTVDATAAAVASMWSQLEAFGGPGSGPRPGYKRNGQPGVAVVPPVDSKGGYTPEAKPFSHVFPHWLGVRNSSEIRYAAEMLLGLGHAPVVGNTNDEVLTKLRNGNDPADDSYTAEQARSRATDAYSMLTAVESAAPVPKRLYRGLTVSDSIPGSESLLKLKSGDEFDVSLAATSEFESDARRFQRSRGSGTDADVPVLMVFDAGARAVPNPGGFDQVSPQFITGGRMEVVDVGRDAATGGVLMRVRQRGVFDPDTATVSYGQALAAAAGSGVYARPEFWQVFDGGFDEMSEPPTVEASMEFGGPGSGPRPGYKAIRSVASGGVTTAKQAIKTHTAELTKNTLMSAKAAYEWLGDNSPPADGDEWIAWMNNIPGEHYGWLSGDNGPLEKLMDPDPRIRAAAKARISRNASADVRPYRPYDSDTPDVAEVTAALEQKVIETAENPKIAKALERYGPVEHIIPIQSNGRAGGFYSRTQNMIAIEMSRNSALGQAERDRRKGQAEAKGGVLALAGGRNVDSGDIATTLRHEIGHHVHAQMETKDPQWKRQIDAEIQSVGRTGMESISAYAGGINNGSQLDALGFSREAFAETFALVTHPDFDRSTMPDHTQRLIGMFEELTT